jgi:hypothetical protein
VVVEGVFFRYTRRILQAQKSMFRDGGC